MGTDGIHQLAAAHALDALDPVEREEFEAHLATCEQCREEVAALQEAAAALAYAAPAVDPPPRLRESLLERAREERGVVVPFRRRRVERALAYVALPAAAAAIGFGVWAGVLHGRLDDQRRDAAAMSAVLSDPAASRVSLGNNVGELVVGRDGQGVLVVRKLSPAPPSKTYEAWVIEDGKAAPAGLFRDRDVVALSRPVPRNATVAITVEPEGGSDQPTSKPFATAQA